jgi:hypothetical protein
MLTLCQAQSLFHFVHLEAIAPGKVERQFLHKDEHEQRFKLCDSSF